MLERSSRICSNRERSVKRKLGGGVLFGRRPIGVLKDITCVNRSIEVIGHDIFLPAKMALRAAVATNLSSDIEVVVDGKPIYRLDPRSIDATRPIHVESPFQARKRLIPVDSPPSKTYLRYMKAWKALYKWFSNIILQKEKTNVSDISMRCRPPTPHCA